MDFRVFSRWFTSVGARLKRRWDTSQGGRCRDFTRRRSVGRTGGTNCPNRRFDRFSRGASAPSRRSASEGSGRLRCWGRNRDYLRRADRRTAVHAGNRSTWRNRAREPLAFDYFHHRRGSDIWFAHRQRSISFPSSCVRTSELLGVAHLFADGNNHGPPFSWLRTPVPCNRRSVWTCESLREPQTRNRASRGRHDCHPITAEFVGWLSGYQCRACRPLAGEKDGDIGPRKNRCELHISRLWSPRKRFRAHLLHWNHEWWKFSRALGAFPAPLHWAARIMCASWAGSLSCRHDACPANSSFPSLRDDSRIPDYGSCAPEHHLVAGRSACDRVRIDRHLLAGM